MCKTTSRPNVLVKTPPTKNTNKHVTQHNETRRDVTNSKIDHEGTYDDDVDDDGPAGEDASIDKHRTIIDCNIGKGFTLALVQHTRRWWWQRFRYDQYQHDVRETCPSHPNDDG